MDKKFTLDVLNLLKKHVLENSNTFGDELTGIMISEIDELIDTTNEVSDEIQKIIEFSKNGRDLEMYKLASLYEDLSTLYEDSHNLLSEINIMLHLNNMDDNWKLWKNLGDKLYICDNFCRALFCYNKALNINPKNPEFLCKKGYVLLRLHKNDLAIKYFKKTLDLDKNNYKAFFGLGKAYYSMSDERSSIKYFEKVLELNPKDKEALEYLGHNYYDITD